MRVSALADHRPSREERLADLARRGFRDPAAADSYLMAIRSDAQATQPAGQEGLDPERFAAHAIEAAAGCSEPQRALREMADLLRQRRAIAADGGAARPGANGYLALERAATIIATSPSLGHLLVEHPSLLRHLEAPAGDGLPPLASAARAALDDGLGGSEDEVIRSLREFKHERLLRILTLDLEGVLDLDQVSHALSDLADLLISAVLSRVSSHLGLGTPSPIGVVCYGKLGSREMSYSSDTDIVFVYDRADGDYDQELVRLARLANHWMTTSTGHGVLYATDFRLRPYGDSGMVVSSLGAFREYQLNAAWTWEHQALTRARWLACSPALGRSLDAVKAAVMGRPRDPDQLRADVLAMRDRIFASHRVSPDTFDVKHSRGGIVDLEFIVQHMILRHAARHPELGVIGDNATALDRGAALGILPAELIQAATSAYRQYRHWMHRERLAGNECVLVSPDRAEPHRRAVMALWRASFPSVRDESHGFEAGSP
jgi:glutamate-ammonia-ligase adenylyltransferase